MRRARGSSGPGFGVRFGEAARRAFLSDLAARRYDVACLEADDYQRHFRAVAPPQGGSFELLPTDS